MGWKKMVRFLDSLSGGELLFNLPLQGADQPAQTIPRGVAPG